MTSFLTTEKFWDRLQFSRNLWRAYASAMKKSMWLKTGTFQIIKSCFSFWMLLESKIICSFVYFLFQIILQHVYTFSSYLYKFQVHIRVNCYISFFIKIVHKGREERERKKMYMYARRCNHMFTRKVLFQQMQKERERIILLYMMAVVRKGHL